MTFKLQQHDENFEDIEIDLLLESIYRYYGFDFRNYAFSFLKRRIWNRLRAERVNNISELQGALLRDHTIMERLFADFSINITEMFRDPSFFLAFRRKAVPILKEYPLIRIWHVGCSSGEEVYSMAILLHEEGLIHKAKIYATDMNKKVIEKAKKGSFSLHKMQQYTKNYLAAGGKTAFSEYYTAKQENATFHSFLTENVVFAQHNLSTDGSFNEFHVIICRNVLIYFNRDLQKHVFDLFNESLTRRGILGLGSKETIKFIGNENDYEEVDVYEKLYRKK
ncbi:CheR family methyltransferase [Metabacillus fastidiosus]|uniref:Protein-glutamate O-methyltransferase CheR n=1 Tax=Metabacillus fastidiosus TaxID=1458 RepID=A0ABU6P5V3_9BACI|nr:protein-glutamate O-methyltransferase CheR [Metabacillus fastidiosus]MED4403541.1 protein-glutamate O-methyltransferase CheR [Metabacillus fastidiosus]MED4455669.1 protein-glutamate O-methyltransferase CheR [Metabacillus fastidiosus]MED4463733.1 protein-glutamate O-methyltransferase CheR [Metabacillus fastidiosus]